ncbi:MAG TPA: FG-GAP-like repeat-containing protein [Phycisphaerae bacterium]|nr:FG-GAP-like repeat-containing protein [Phycisphaerae bacterium]HRY70874.1 FG-GAP-like repeat-containing protein [Phycisphaerae bacterium]HSA29126.1 FG-GAP-like repeat-containing protein [Phycisphaerae bacterium]
MTHRNRVILIFVSVIAGWTIGDWPTPVQADCPPFAEQVTYPANRAPRCVALGDLDGDGDLDMAAGNGDGWGTANVTWRMNNGDGTFGALTEFKLEYMVGRANLVAIAELTGDNRADLIYTVGNTVFVLRNQGDGSFTPYSSCAPYDEVYAVAVGDMDNDNDNDLVIAGHHAYPVGFVAIAFNDGTGKFPQVTTRYFDYSRTGGVAIGDLDGDGARDIAYPRSSPGSDGARVVGVLWNNSPTLGEFSAEQEFYAGWWGPARVAIVRANNDELDDLVAHFGAASISVLLNQGSRSFAPAVVSVNATGYGPYMATGDVNDDGVADLVMGGGSYEVAVRLNNGDGTFADSIKFGVGWLSTFAAVGDLNNDDWGDIVVANGAWDTISVLMSQAPIIIIAEQPAGQKVQAGDPASMHVRICGAGMAAYQWKKGGEDLVDNERISGAKTATLKISHVEAADCGSAYQVVISNGCSSVTSSDAVLSLVCAVVLPADLDGNCGVDQADLALFVSCFSGPAISHNGTPTCRQADFDTDDDVDQNDFGVLQRSFTCPGGLTCGGVCVDLMTDPDNCGSCGTVCDPGEACTGGQCLNPSSQADGQSNGFGLVSFERCVLGPAIANGGAAAGQPGSVVAEVGQPDFGLFLRCYAAQVGVIEPNCFE